MAGPAQAIYLCHICGKPVDINTAKTDDAGRPVHEECYVLRELLKQRTMPTNGLRAG